MPETPEISLPTQSVTSPEVHLEMHLVGASENDNGPRQVSCRFYLESKPYQYDLMILDILPRKTTRYFLSYGEGWKAKPYTTRCTAGARDWHHHVSHSIDWTHKFFKAMGFEEQFIQAATLLGWDPNLYEHTED